MAQKKSKGSGSRRPISKKRFDKIEAGFKSASQTFATFDNEVERLEQIISTRSIITQSEKKGEDPVTINLSTAEIDGYKLQLRQAKLNRKKAKKAKKSAEDDYTNACRHNAACIMDKAKKFNKKLESEQKAVREKESKKEQVLGIVQSLKFSNASQFNLLVASLNNGREFRKLMDTILKQEDDKTYVLISGLSSVKTEIYNAVKDELLSGSADAEGAFDTVTEG